MVSSSIALQQLANVQMELENLRFYEGQEIGLIEDAVARAWQRVFNDIPDLGHVKAYAQAIRVGAPLVMTSAA